MTLPRLLTPSSLSPVRITCVVEGLVFWSGTSEKTCREGVGSDFWQLPELKRWGYLAHVGLFFVHDHNSKIEGENPHILFYLSPR